MAGLAQTHSKFCDILPHVLPHFDPIAGVRSACSLLQVSTAVRHTVQSCRADFRIHLITTNGVDKLRRQAGAMRWLPHHAGLVSELVLRNTADDQATADTFLELALQACARNATQALPTAAPVGVHAAAVPAAAASGTAGGCTSTGAAAAGAGGAVQRDAPLPLRLTRISYNDMPPPAVLRLLQSAGLQDLRVHRKSAGMLISLYPALASMQELTGLGVFSGPDLRDPLPVAFASALGQLQHLTSLSLYNLTPAGARLLPVSLKVLVLGGPCKDSSGSNEAHPMSADGDLMSLSHLTALSSLDWRNYGGELCDVTLPQQPVELESAGRLRLLGPFNLPGVNIMACSGDDIDFEVLLQLLASPYTCSLTVDLGYVYQLSRSALQQIGTVLGALTNLTQLYLEAREPLRELEHAHVLQQLCKLPSLVDLTLYFDDYDQNREGQDVGIIGMLQLSALTNLTRLCVADFADAGLDEVAASAVAVNLTRLQELCLCSSSMLSWGLLPVVARLTGLRSLVLSKCVDYDEDTDPFLTPALLQQLSTLTLLRDRPAQVESQWRGAAAVFGLPA